MTSNRMRNTLLAIIAFLVVSNIYAVARPAQAAGPSYKAVEPPNTVARDVQAVLDQQTSQGWQYAGSVMGVMIFKR